MSGLNDILKMLGEVAKEVAPLVIPGSGALIKGAESIAAAFDSLKEANGGQAPADAEAAHDALFARVKAHAESTFSRLEGN